MRAACALREQQSALFWAKYAALKWQSNNKEHNWLSPCGLATYYSAFYANIDLTETVATVSCKQEQRKQFDVFCLPPSSFLLRIFCLPQLKTEPNLLHWQGIPISFLSWNGSEVKLLFKTRDFYPFQYWNVLFRWVP